MPATLESRIPMILAELAPRLDAAMAAAAEVIAEDARSQVPVQSGSLRDSIHVEHEGVMDYSVVAGDDRAWYGHIVENGGINHPPHPFLIPALEAQLAAAVGILAAALRGV